MNTIRQIFNLRRSVVYRAPHPLSITYRVCRNPSNSPISLPLAGGTVSRPFARPEDHGPLDSEGVGPLRVPERPAVLSSSPIDEPRFLPFDPPYQTIATAQRQAEQLPPAQPSFRYYDDADSESGENQDCSRLCASFAVFPPLYSAY